MSQIFHRSTNTLSRVSIYGAVFIIGVLGYVSWAVNESSYFTYVKMPLNQPIPFSHKHHAAELGIDCRYCHTSVETSYYAGMPATQTCMTCHSQIWVNSSMLEPVRASYRTGDSIEWTRVNALPDFVYFNHSIHIHKGIGCTTCHGQVGEMPITWRENSLYMRWCLNCHNHPEQYVRPRADVFEAIYHPPNQENPLTYQGVSYSSQAELGPVLVKRYQIRRLTSCDTCHR